MENAAHAELLDHEVYRTPLVVQPEFESRKTPGSYRRTYLGPGVLPDQFKVWRVQNSQVGNVVALSRGFLDSPDAEIIAVGFNHGKEYGAIGIGRHGNFLQWGYGDTPSRMTEAGRRLFLNCIHYIRRFEGKAPLVRKRRSDRLQAVRIAPLGDRLREWAERDSKVTPGIAMDILKRYVGDPNGLAQYFRDNLEWVYYDKGLRIDEELKSLGIESNRRIESLGRLIELLDDAQHAATAKTLLGRYTDRTFETPPQWRQWFNANKDRVFFSDVGGYKFFVVPEGYLIGPDRETATGQSSSR
ncbi:MAG: hypothetical protein A2Y77_11050 [Planctomycetes bacterium RBG_13_62_9]|nr:MAG: hypothetical protein A2Y77_11050 [Planctomycetes bacterium RBG_13_62_9]